MNMDKIHKIEELIERFFEGMTSNEEEKELYKFFSSNEIPEHLKKYKPVFEYFEQGIVDETNKNEDIKTIQQQESPKNRKRLIYTVSGIAASILIVLSGYYLFNKDSAEFNPYEGSYIVRNGVRITDMNIIQSELENTYQEVMQQQEKTKKTIEETLNQGQVYYDIEHQIKDQYNDLLEQMTDDEYAKKEIKKMFESI